jgi:cysteine protease ATG4
LIEDGCTPPHEDKFEMIGPQHLAQAVTPPDSTASSIDSTQISYESAAGGQDGGWPSSFLDDFEARIWLTYRSNFPAIAKSQDPKALSSMSFKVRLSQLVDPGGFTSDTGWGCMIRSGQSLLANTLVMLQLGRGLPIFWIPWISQSNYVQIGAADHQVLRSGRSYHYSQMTLVLPILFTDSWNMVLLLAANILGNGLDHQRLPVAFSKTYLKVIIKHTNSERALTNTRKPSDVRVYITGDGSDVYEDAFMSIARPDGVRFIPTLILVGTRLGLEKITPVYWEALKSSLQMPQSIGIAG